MSSPKPQKAGLRAQRVLFGILVGCAAVLQLAFLVNMLMWRSAPDRGWYAVSGLGMNVIGDTRPLGEESGLRRGDRIRTINGQPYETLEEMYALLDPEIGQVNVYTLERAGEVLTVTVPVSDTCTVQW